VSSNAEFFSADFYFNTQFFFLSHRERNKILARKSRLKVKNDLESLKQHLVCLMKENESLKKQIECLPLPTLSVEELVRNDVLLPDSVAGLIKHLLAMERNVSEKTISPKKMKNISYCISNAISNDLPLVYASPGFLRLTGYEMHEILGRNCRFLQGPQTDQNEILRLKKAVSEGKDVVSVLLNYRKDGTTFWNQVKLAHLKDETGKTFLIVGIQTKVSKFDFLSLCFLLILILQYTFYIVTTCTSK
jgi:PAS domain S-box-containing protein